MLKSLQTIDLDNLDAATGGEQRVRSLQFTRDGRCLSHRDDRFGRPLEQPVNEPVAVCINNGLRPGQSRSFGGHGIQRYRLGYD